MGRESCSFSFAFYPWLFGWPFHQMFIASHQSDAQSGMPSFKFAGNFGRLRTIVKLPEKHFYFLLWPKRDSWLLVAFYAAQWRVKKPSKSEENEENWAIFKPPHGFAPLYVICYSILIATFEWKFEFSRSTSRTSNKTAPSWALR